MNTGNSRHELYPLVAPVELRTLPVDAVSHSLAVLSTVYNYNHWIFASVRDYLGPRVVEVGSGVGNITQFLLNADEVVCLEPFEPYRQFLTRRFEKHLNVSVHPNLIEECPNSQVPSGHFDSVLCLNVLEHIREDVKALKAMKELVRPGGQVVVLVPALPCLYGAMDRAMGHVRRYTLRSLRAAFAEAGLKPQVGHYMNMVGVFGWWWHGRVRRKATIPESATMTFDRLVPFLSAVERLLPVLFGQSVLVVGVA
jgi:SAM-dependent methyltransferase